MTSLVRTHSHWSMHAVSRRLRVFLRSPSQRWAMSSRLSEVNMIVGYRSCIFSLFLSMNFLISSGCIGSRIYVRQRERRALITVKLGFSVVAPIRVMIHFSTHGRRTSCWLFIHLWISSRKRIVCFHAEKFFCAFAMIFTTSSFFARTAERWKNSPWSEFAMTRAILVFPHPGGHHKRREGRRHASINLRIGFPSPIRFDCPTRSSRDSGRSRDARGVMSFWSREFMRWF